MPHILHHKVGTALIVLAALFIGVVLTLVTPLRHVSLLTPTINEIQPQEFYDLYKQNPDNYVFIDVRNKESYDRLHAEGSSLMQLHTLYDEWRNLPKNNDKTIVLICSGGKASGVGYHYLEHHGFFNILRVEGGIEAWQLQGLPVASKTE